MIVWGIMTIGALLGYVAAAMYFQRRLNALRATEEALARANAQTAGANEIIALQRQQIDVLRNVVHGSREEIAQLLKQEGHQP